VGRLLNAIPRWLLGLVLQALNGLWGLLSQTVLTVPDVTALPQVQQITGTCTVVVNTCFGLLVVTAGIVVMTRETLQVRYGISEVGPRLVVAFIAANMAAVITRGLTGGANTLTAALTGEGISSPGAFSQLRDTVSVGLSDPAAPALVAVIGAIIAVLVGMLVALWLVRLGVLVVLAGIAPLALACHALPYTEAAAKLWWRAMLGTLGTVVAQAFALHAALSVFLDPHANLPALGLPGDPSGTLNLFIVACLLWAVVKIPGLMSRYVTRGGGHSPGGYVLRVVLAQRLTRGLGRGRGPGRGRIG
jgi:hypothetical protein